MNLTFPQAILFDFDDTLVSSQDMIFTALENTLKEFKIKNVDIDDIKRWGVNSAKNYFPRFFHEKTPEAIEFFRLQYIELSADGIQPMKNSIDSLEYILNHPKKPFVGVVSNKSGPLLRKEISKLGWDKYFDNIVGAGDAVEDKPSIEPLKFALLDSGIDPNIHDVWFIGDSHVDMEAAYKFNCFSILINETLDLELLQPFVPKLHIKNHQELLNFMKSC